MAKPGPNSLANLKKFKPGQSGNPAGKPKKTLEQRMVSNRELLRTIDKQREIDRVLRLTPEQLKSELGDKTKDVFGQLIGRWTYMSLTSKDPSVVREFLEHIFGKPKETLKVESDHKITIEHIKVQEIRQILQADPFMKKEIEHDDRRTIETTASRVRESGSDSNETGS